MVEDKRQTTIYLLKDVFNYCKENKINLSEWVNTEFTKQYLSLTSKQEELARLQKEITEIKERVETQNKLLTSREIRYICQVKARQREGKDLTSMWRWFNTEYNRKLSFAEFEELVEFYERQAVKRVEEAMKNVNARKDRK